MTILAEIEKVSEIHVAEPKQLALGIIGSSSWGINYVRLLNQFVDTDLVAVCDQDERIINNVNITFPSIKTFINMADLLELEHLDAVIVSTNPTTHYDITRFFLEAGKHVLVEKPMTTRSIDSRLLISIADEKNLVLMVGYIFLYNPGVEKIKSYIERGKVGNIHYLYARRTNLGPIRRDVNAIWDLAPHDVSIMNYWLDSSPVWVSASGATFLKGSAEDVGFITLGYPNGVICQIHVSWADPHKEHEVVIVGSNERITFNDILFQEKVRVYEKGISAVPKPTSYGEYQLSIRDGDIIIPYIKIDEPQKIQVTHFFDCIREGKKPLSDGRNGLQVVRVLEAVDRSIAKNGIPIMVEKDE
jgi:predicted dehydrogenase